MEEMRMAGSKTKDKKKSVANFTTQDDELTKPVVPEQSEQVLTKPDTRSPEGWPSTEEAKTGFIVYFSEHLITISKACDILHIGRTTVYDWIAQDPEFKKAFEQAELMQREVALGKFYDLVDEKDGPSIRFYLERRVPGWQQKQLLQHTVGDKTLEDLIDENNAIEDAKTVDGGVTENPQQGQGDSAVQVQRVAGVLLEQKDAAQPDPQTPTEGAE